MMIKAVPEDRERGDEGSDEALNTSGKLRYRVNCIGKLIIQIRLERFVVGKGWKQEWVDAKAHHVTLIED